jgi:hypothetical protein
MAGLEPRIAEPDEQWTEVPVPAELGVRRLKKTPIEPMARFRELVRSDLPLARQALRRLPPEPVEFVPTGYGIELRGKVGPGDLFPACLGVASPRGFEPYAGDLVLPLVA